MRETLKSNFSKYESSINIFTRLYGDTCIQGITAALSNVKTKQNKKQTFTWCSCQVFEVACFSLLERWKDLNLEPRPFSFDWVFWNFLPPILAQSNIKATEHSFCARSC